MQGVYCNCADTKHFQMATSLWIALPTLWNRFQQIGVEFIELSPSYPRMVHKSRILLFNSQKSMVLVIEGDSLMYASICPLGTKTSYAITSELNLLKC